jgi:hypothetical protein
MHGAWSGETRVHSHTVMHDCFSPSAGLDIHHAVEYYKARVPAAKLVLGLATYGKTFELPAGALGAWLRRAGAVLCCACCVVEHAGACHAAPYITV